VECELGAVKKGSKSGWKQTDDMMLEGEILLVQELDKDSLAKLA